MIPIVPPPTQVIVAYLPKEFHEIGSKIFYKGDTKLIESHKIWTDFEEISTIYRESGHNQEISDYLKNQLQKDGFDVVQKPNDGTICASRGLNKEHNNAIILQAHMDMVAISADGNPKKPIKMNIKDGWLYANDRTLGGDDGLGVAAILAIASDPKFQNTPLEMIITTNEETGMDGARKLSEKDFYGKYLINLDSEEFGIIIKGCAGIAQFDVKEKIKFQTLENDKYSKITVNLSGARGGHSATITSDSLIPLDILLAEFEKIKNLKLVSLSSGERYNAIPRDASAEFLIPQNNQKEVIKTLQADLEKVKNDNSGKNLNFEYSITTKNAQFGEKYIDSEFQTKMIKALKDIPTGLLTKFQDEESTKTSQNLGVIKISNGEFFAQIMGRSSDKKEGQELQAKTAKILSELFDKPISVSDNTPIWQPQHDSILQDAAVKAFSAISKNKKPTVKVEHGGLESAIFIQTKPDLEQISIGPTIEEPHSIQERVKVDTVIPFYEWLSKIIELLPAK